MSKLKLEAILKSALAGAAVGFGVNFVASTVFWFTAWGGLGFSLAIFAAVSVAAGLLFYFKLFRPTDKRSARRIDRMGLYERMITMVEYENDDSYIAKIQREDAKRHLAALDVNQIKIKISKAILTSFITCSILGTTMTTVSALSEQGIIPGGDEFFGNMNVIKVSYWVTYEVKDEEGGVIIGEAEQLVQVGESATTVTALADEGYIFKQWSDGVLSPTRTDTDISEDVVFVAEFAPLEESMEADEGDIEGDEDPFAPQTNKNQNGQDGAGEPSGDPNEALTGAGKYEPNNQIINGNTYYREVISQYQDTANERLIEEDSNLSEAEKEMIKKYLGIV